MITSKYFQKTLQQLQKHPGVKGVIVTNTEGLPISSTLSTEKTEIISAQITSLVGKASKVITELGEGTLNFLTLDAGESELHIAPEEEYVLIVLRAKNAEPLPQSK
ncbi:MAG: roadblock/LC7 domain-containing protein [Candidatus Lokiarchaeia archaeon]|jgi:predicted regulator of Ras-like GTPase activity (Roadblock/LC7/MglB family)